MFTSPGASSARRIKVDVPGKFALRTDLETALALAAQTILSERFEVLLCGI